jgi:glycosyltransferase involved in cell wall biosynthesis
MVTPKSTVRYSIIIIVKNDRGIDETIQDLKAHVPMETTEIVVIDASGDALKDIQEKYPEVQWNHFVSKTGKKISIPEQRNAGMAAAHGQIIIFVDANGFVDFAWKVITRPNQGARCDFVDLTTPTPRPIPGLQNLDPTVDKARITNIQSTTRFCLICQFYNLTTNESLGEAVAHQWIRIIQVGEN